jgi:hypothetical protein
MFRCCTQRKNILFVCLFIYLFFEIGSCCAVQDGLEFIIPLLQLWSAGITGMCLYTWPRQIFLMCSSCSETSFHFSIVFLPLTEDQNLKMAALSTLFHVLWDHFSFRPFATACVALQHLVLLLLGSAWHLSNWDQQCARLCPKGALWVAHCPAAWYSNPLWVISLQQLS